MRAKPKVVVDTNVFISALMGKSNTLLKIHSSFLNKEFIPIFSSDTLTELINVAKRPEFNEYFSADAVERLESLIKLDALIVPISESIRLCRDVKDNMILEAAVSSEADFLVTGDKDLLILENIKGIPIITPRAFLKKLKS